MSGEYMDEFQIKLQIKMDTIFLRNMELGQCKTQKEKDILLDRWSHEDSMEKIADAIRSVGNQRPKFLGIF